jgi:integrase
MIYKRGTEWHFDVLIPRSKRWDIVKLMHRRLEPKRRGAVVQRKLGTAAEKRFCDLPFAEAAELFRTERLGFLSERTIQFEKERSRPLVAFFGTKPIRKIRADDIRAYQKLRLEAGRANKTINMEVGILRLMLKRASIWLELAAQVKLLPKRPTIIPRVLTPDQKEHLFRIASGRSEWTVAYCAAVLAVSTTCRGMELKHLKWSDVDFTRGIVLIQRSKTLAGHRTIPLNGDAVLALTHLRQRAEVLGSNAQHHFVFPTCENQRVDPTKPQKSWRSAWRSLTRLAGFEGLRFHDLRHQAITELAEAGMPDATIMAIAGHVDRTMMEHYSHTRLDAKRHAVSSLDGVFTRKRIGPWEEDKQQIIGSSRRA